MENLRPAEPPLTGVRRMKKSPGMVRRPEKMKNQRRLPMMSNTTAGLSSECRSTDRSGEELLLGHAEQPRLTRGVLANDEAQDGPGHGDRGEHRDEHTDDQDEREASNRRRAEPVQDPGRDEARHVRVEDRVPRSGE